LKSFKLIQHKHKHTHQQNEQIRRHSPRCPRRCPWQQRLYHRAEHTHPDHHRPNEENNNGYALLHSSNINNNVDVDVVEPQGQDRSRRQDQERFRKRQGRRLRWIHRRCRPLADPLFGLVGRQQGTLSGTKEYAMRCNVTQ